MSSLPRFSVGQPVLVNLLMLGIIFGGLFALFAMPQELNPNISFNWAFVTVPYSGASPAEVEDLIIIPLEKEIDKVEHVDEILSTAGEGWGFVMVKFEDLSDSEFSTAMQELRTHVEQADLPDEAEDPVLEDFGSDDFAPVISIAITFEDDGEQAARIADRLSDEIKRISDVAKTQLSGLEDREIWVEVDPTRLNAYNLTLGAVVQTLARRNINLPGGDITIGRTEFLVRAVSRYTSLEEIEQSVLMTGADGALVLLKDVARVRMTRAEATILSRLDKKPSITISVSKSAGGSTYEVVDAIRTRIDEFRREAPAGVDFIITMDASLYIDKILGVLRNNALVGIVFIFAILFAFLGTSNALLAALGIPLSFLITFILMYYTGQTVNGSSLFALIIVLGIIVDDAIIVLENVHTYRQRGLPLRDAVIQGAEEVLGPITTGILTTIAAFVPLMLLPGIMGKFMRVVPLVVSLALFASLFEATVMLPAHINDWTRGSRRHLKREFGFYLWLLERYERRLRAFLRRRYFVVAGVLIILFAAAAAIPLVGVELFGEEELDFFTALVRMPEGTSLEETDRIIRKIEDRAAELPADDITSIVANTGLLQGNNEWITRKSVGQVLVNLVPAEDRKYRVSELIEMLRKNTDDISGISSLDFETPSGGPPTGKPVSVRIAGKYLEELRAAAEDLKVVLRRIPGVSGIQDDFPQGKQEIRIKIDEQRAALHGFSPQEISLEIRTAIEGLTATTYREGDEDIDIVVKLAEERDESIEAIRSLGISNRRGGYVPLENVAAITLHDGASEIKRRNLKRTMIVSSDLDQSVNSMDKVVRDLQPHFDTIGRRYKDVRFEIGGEFEEFTTAFNNIAQLFLIGIILIYLILGTQFRSYIQPLVILGTVPLAFIGAMVGLLVNGDKFSIITLFGVVALAGIVVNDSIVMIAFINNARRQGMDRWQSVIEGGKTRLRPIILTSVTTIGGLLPTALGIGGSSGVWRPLASTIAWGLLFSTVLTLLVIPCVFSIVDDIKTKTGQALVRRED